jgi:hypothetical protein
MNAMRTTLLPIAAGDMIIRTYDPRPPQKGHGGRGILVVAGLLGFVWVVSHAQQFLNSDDGAATIVTTVTASAVPPATPATPDNPTTTSADPTAPQSGADTNDQAFISTLDASRIANDSNWSHLIAVAKAVVCTSYDEGFGDTDVFAFVREAEGWSLSQSAFFVGASVAAFCPRYQGYQPGTRTRKL